jgi:hypothetical protein
MPVVQSSVNGTAGSAYPGISVFMTNCESYQYWKFPSTFTTYTLYGIDSGLLRCLAVRFSPRARCKSRRIKFGRRAKLKGNFRGTVRLATCPMALTKPELKLIPDWVGQLFPRGKN